MDARPKSAYEMTAITSLYGIDNQSKREITIHDKNKASSKLHVYGSSVSMEEAVRSTVESVSQDTDPVTPPQYSARIYEQTDDDILAALDPSKLTTQAERESYFRRFGLLPPSERGVKRHPNIVNNKDITGSTTGLAMIAVSGSPSDVSIT